LRSKDTPTSLLRSGAEEGSQWGRRSGLQSPAQLQQPGGNHGLASKKSGGALIKLISKRRESRRKQAGDVVIVATGKVVTR
jgi:hypothetical protein